MTTLPRETARAIDVVRAVPLLGYEAVLAWWFGLTHGRFGCRIKGMATTQTTKIRTAADTAIDTALVAVLGPFIDTVPPDADADDDALEICQSFLSLPIRLGPEPTYDVADDPYATEYPR